MAEYIEREALMNEIHRIGGHNLCGWDTIGVKALVDRQPTADVVEVVRCKNCKYFDIEEDDALGTCMGKFICISSGGEIYPEPNHYCSYGERRSE